MGIAASFILKNFHHLFLAYAPRFLRCVKGTVLLIDDAKETLYRLIL